MNTQTHLGKRVKFSIYTQDLNRDAVIRLVGEEFPSSTLIAAQGVWHDTVEESLVIEIIAHEANRGAVHSVAHKIKRHNSQEAVMVIESPIDTLVMI
jgi:hypothetical protein